MYLSSKSWETRIAAGQAVEAIARNVKKWQPGYQPKQGEENGTSHTSVDTSADLLSFETFNINKVCTCVCMCVDVCVCVWMCVYVCGV